MAGKPTVIYAARTMQEAYQLKNALTEAGIRALVTNEVLEGGAGVDILGWPTLARVAVAEEDARRARLVALDFEQKIAGKSAAVDQCAEPGLTAGPPAQWPRCPQCGARRITSCPVCHTAGTEFAQADTDLAGLWAPQQQTHTERPGQGRQPADQPATGAKAGEDAGLMLVCPTCDEPFVPRYPRRCEWCSHQFDDGYDPEPEPGQQLGPRAAAVMVALLVVVLGLVIYFAWLL